MASNINDYTLELGWDAQKVNKGIEELEDRLDKIAAKTEKIVNPPSISKNKANVFSPTRSNTAVVSQKEQLVDLEDKQLSIVNSILSKERQIARLKQSIDPTSAKGRALHKDLDNDVRQLERFRRKVKETQVSSKKDIKDLKGQWSKLNHEIGESTIRVRGLSREMGVLSKVGRRAAASFTSYAAAGIGAYAAANLASSVYQTAKAFDALEVSMLAGFGSESEATKQMEYVRGFAKENAVDIVAAAEGWAKLGINAEKSGISMNDAREIYEATLMSSRAFNLSADDTKGAIRAIGQIMSKEKVNAEDFRLQLAERMPAAMANLREATGMTKDEFSKAFQEGKIPFDALAKWAKVQRKMVVDSGALAKSLTTMAAGQTLFTNALKETANILFTDKLDNAIGGLFKTMGDFLEKNSENVKSLGDAFADLFQAIDWGITNFVGPLLTWMFNFLGDTYRMFQDISRMDIIDAFQEDGAIKWMRIFTGLVWDAVLGWAMISKTVRDFSWQGLKDEVSFLSGLLPANKDAKSRAAKEGRLDAAGNFKDQLGTRLWQRGMQFSGKLSGLNDLLGLGPSTSTSETKNEFNFSFGNVTAIGEDDLKQTVREVTEEALVSNMPPGGT